MGSGGGHQRRHHKQLITLMSFEDLIIRVPAAAALLSYFPLVTAIGAMAPDNPDDAYPPWCRSSFFDTLTNTAFCSYNNFLDRRSTMTRSLTMAVEDNMVNAAVVDCPEANSRPAFYITYYDSTHRLRSYRREGRNAFEFIFDYHPLPNNTGLNPLRLIEISSILDKKNKLDLAASMVEFLPEGYDGDSLPWSDDEDDNGGGAFFNENDYDIAEEDEEPKQHTFNAWRKRRSYTATTELPVEELKEVCLAVMEVVEETFPDFNHLCAVSYKAAEEALTAAELSSWQFVPITDRWHRVIPPASE